VKLRQTGHYLAEQEGYKYTLFGAKCIVYNMLRSSWYFNSFKGSLNSLLAGLNPCPRKAEVPVYRGFGSSDAGF